MRLDSGLYLAFVPFHFYTTIAVIQIGRALATACKEGAYSHSPFVSGKGI